jgi:hypothetical protein
MPETREPAFRRGAEWGTKLALLALAALAGTLLALAVWRARSYEPIGEPVVQPIPFSHKHHAGDDGIDCRYCHTTVEREAHAGLPSTAICLGCHSQLYADQPVLAPLRDSAASGRPIAWQRVHVLPDFVFFDHSVHVSNGVGCAACHGRVDQMPLTWRQAPLQMQWCLDCHRHAAERVPTARMTDVRRLTDCSTCHR